MKNYLSTVFALIIYATSFSQAVQQRLGPTGKVYYDTLYPALSATSPLIYVPSSGIFSLGNIPVTKLNSGTGASASSYWRGDGTWATPGGGGSDSAIWKNDGTYIGDRVLTMGAYSQYFKGGRLLGDSLRIGTTRINQNAQGLFIGFNDSTGTNTSGANIDITNLGTSGFGGTQSYDNITGSGNVKIVASSTNKPKAGGSQPISGLNNTILNSHAPSATALSGNDNLVIGTSSNGVTSGSNNIGLGFNALRGISTGGTNGTFITRNTAGSATLANVSDSWLFGDVSGLASAIAGDIIFSPYFYGTATRLYLGGKVATGAAQTVEIYATPNGAGNVGNVFNLNASSGTGDYGTINTKFGTTIIQKNESSGLTIGRATSLAKTSASTVFDVQSTTQGSMPFPRMTNTQRDAMSASVLSLTITAAGTGYGNTFAVPLTFSGGGGTGAAGYAVANAGGVLITAVVTSSGTGYTSAPTVTVGGSGTGATITSALGIPEGLHIYSLTDHADEYYNGSVWKTITTN